MTREQWLKKLVERLRPVLREAGGEVPSALRVSCGWPSTGALAAKKRSVGECWYYDNSADGTTEIYVSPALSDPMRVAGVVAHELVHACVGREAGHKRPFKRLATAIGLTGKMTATEEGPEFVKRLTPILERLGPYPHAALSGVNRPKQGARLVKVECECGCIARMTRKWLEQVGPPICGCGCPMEETS